MLSGIKDKEKGRERLRERKERSYFSFHISFRKFILFGGDDRSGFVFLRRQVTSRKGDS